MLRLMGFESHKSKLLHGGQRLYGAITEHVDTGVLHRAFDIGSTFWSTYVLLSLHVWLVVHRLRESRGSDVRFFRQQFYNQFQQDVEYRVYAAGLQVGVSKWLKRLEEHWYETAFELDQALSRQSNDTLAEVVLRKYYGGEERHRPNADLLARYAARELQCLTLTDEAALLRGHVRFSTLLAPALVRAGLMTATAAEAAERAAGAGAPPKAAPQAPPRTEDGADLKADAEAEARYRALAEAEEAVSRSGRALGTKLAAGALAMALGAGPEGGLVASAAADAAGEVAGEVAGDARAAAGAAVEAGEVARSSGDTAESPRHKA